MVPLMVSLMVSLIVPTNAVSKAVVKASSKAGPLNRDRTFHALFTYKQLRAHIKGPH